MSCPNCEKIKKSTSANTNGNGSSHNAFTREYLFIIFSLGSLVLGFILSKSSFHIPLFPLTDPSWIAIILCGFPIFKAASHALIYSRKITSSLLISIAIFAAITLQLFIFFKGNNDAGHVHDSYIFAAGEIAFLMALGGLIEAWTVKKSRKGIEALMTLAPKLAQRKSALGIETVPVESLVPDDIVFVRPDDRIPADGTIIEGESSVNQACLTGESVPVDKYLGDEVLAGTWNQSGALTLRVNKSNAENTISRLINLVHEAEEKKAPIQHIADRWASRIVPVAILCSGLVALFAYFILGTSFLDATIRGVTILVVFCPCAFALATPTAIAAGIGNASRRGILIKSGEALEKLAQIDTIVFDKTGTLTRADLKIESSFLMGTFSEKEVLIRVAAAEKLSQHPIARALVSAAQGIALPTTRNISSKSGLGITCNIGDEEIFVGSVHAVEQEKILIPSAAKKFITSRQDRGETLVCLVINSTLEGIFSLSDSLRENVPTTIQRLKKNGLDTVMLTGDNNASAQNIGKASGISSIFSELLPENKAAKISALRKNGKSVLMIGDGVNDAPALVSADCSIAMGALGSEIAVETADIAILNDNLALVPGLLNFSKAVLKTVHVNFGISLTINILSLVLSTVGILNPVTGAIVHNVSSIIVVSNAALLLLRKKDFS